MLIELIIYLFPFWGINTGLNLLGYLKKRSAFIAKLDYPIDFKKTIATNNRILGESTTWLGLPVVVVLGFLSQLIFRNPQNGIITGIVVFCGHAIGSFIKRRLKIPDGKFIPIIDHGDYVILGAIVFLSLHKVKVEVAILSILLTLIFQPLFCYIGYKLGLRDHPL